MYSTFAIWRHWYTWSECRLTHLGNYAAAEFGDTGAAWVGWVGRSNSCPVTVQYVAGYISSPRRSLCPPYSSDWTIETLD